MKTTKKYLFDLSYEVLGSAIEVHKHLGPGLLESVYEKCFVRELAIRKINFESQRWIQTKYKGLLLDTELRLDVLVENALCVELKAIDAFAPIHDAVLLTYMRMLEMPKGILINFNSTNIAQGGRRILVNEYFRALPDG